MSDRVYIAIDLKSYYASVECVERHLDPLKTNLVVADPSRTQKTICLAVSPSLKAYGISGRARLYEVVRRVNELNRVRLANAIKARKAVKVNTPQDLISFQPYIAKSDNEKEPVTESPDYCFASASYDANELASDPYKELTYIIAPPRMMLYMEYSTKIFSIYLKYVHPSDILVYSIDQCFIDATDYLKANQVTAKQFAMMLIREVICLTGITATVGIGTNMFLCKVAMDIVAKHIPPDEHGVRIAELNELSYRQQLWTHTPLTDFWRIGSATAAKLEKLGLYTMGDIALYSETCSERLYKLFGVEAQYLIDHAWGWEPCTISIAKSYIPSSKSISKGQVLAKPYAYTEGKLIVMEMADDIAFELTENVMQTDQLTLNIFYDAENTSTVALTDLTALAMDEYGRFSPKPACGTINLGQFTGSCRQIRKAVGDLFDKIVCKNFTIRRVCLCASRIKSTADLERMQSTEQISLFDDEVTKAVERKLLEKEQALQKAMLGIKHTYGKNAILSGMCYMKGGTAIKRNKEIGGHKA